MASYRKRGRGWEVRIHRTGFPTRSKSFRRLDDGKAWARSIEREMDRRSYRDTRLAESITVDGLLDRYVEGCLKGGPSYTREKSRAKNIRRLLTDYALINLTQRLIAEFRDDRLRFAVPDDADVEERNEIAAVNKNERRVGPQAVIHEMGLLSRALNHAMSEWDVHLPHGNPVVGVRRPKKPRGRERRVTDEELALLTEHADSELLGPLCTFAVQTAMRRGEIAAMEWTEVDLRRRALHIPRTKTDRPRTIPLSRRATAILSSLPRRPDGRVWGVRADSITQAFIRARDRAGLRDLHFHDLRHEAVSRFFELGLGEMQVMEISGHEDKRTLARYTHLQPEHLVAELDRLQCAAGA